MKISSIYLIGVISLIGITTLTSFNNPNDDIVGTWELEDDPNNKWIFTNNGNCYWYNNSILEGSFHYTISETSPQCGFEVRTLSGVENYYLKLTDINNDEYCYEIQGLSETNLSLNYLGQAKIMLFNKI